MFTLFFAGEVFAPKALYTGDNVEFFGKNIGYVLRTSYIRAYARLMDMLKDLPNVLGVDPLNEPHPGYIGLPSLHRFNETTDLHLGYMPNALQSMALAAGIPTSTPYFSRSWPHPSKISRRDILNQDHISAWLPGATDIWQDERVFTISPSGAVELGPKGDKYFSTNPSTGAEIDFEQDHWIPFIRDFHRATVAAVEGGKAGTWLFVEPVPNAHPPVWPSTGHEKICYAPHWYDIRALYDKGLSYNISFDVLSLASGSRNMLAHTYFGSPGLTKNYATNFRRFWKHLPIFRQGATTPTPMLIGETGVPWDMNQQAAYVDGNIHHQLTMTDSVFSAMERAGALNWAFWNFTLTHTTATDIPRLKVANETQAAFQSGDSWNSEDFSIVSSDPATTELPLSNYHGSSVRVNDNGVPLTRAALFGDLYHGLRAAPAYLRPYPFATAGRILKSEFLLDICRFELEFAPSTAAAVKARTTEVFVPAYHFWQRKVVVRLFVNSLKHGFRSEEVVLKWDFMEGSAVGRKLAWRWECARQALEVVHVEGMEEGTVVGVVLEAEGGSEAQCKVSWVQGVGGWFL